MYQGVMKVDNLKKYAVYKLLNCKGLQECSIAPDDKLINKVGIWLLIFGGFLMVFMLIMGVEWLMGLKIVNVCRGFMGIDGIDGIKF